MAKPPSGTAEEDYEGEDVYDDEGTLEEEEEMQNLEDYQEELRILQDDAELTVEELRAKYYANVPAGVRDEMSEDEQSSSTAHSESINEGEEREQSTSDSAEGGKHLSATMVTTDSDYGYFLDVDDIEDDNDYTPPNRKSLRRGPNFQAVVSDGPSKEISQSTAEHGTLLWSPSGRCTSKKVEEFLKSCFDRAAEKEVGQGGCSFEARRVPILRRNFPLKDDENALKALLDARYDVAVALKKHPFEACNAPVVTIGRSSAKWTSEECETFENGIERFNKNFYLIQQTMPHRTVGELVSFYYIWKKTERHDIFAERIISQKGNPNSTDFMGNLIDQLETGSEAHAFDIPSTIPANIEREWRAQLEGSAQSTLPNLDGETVASVLQ